MSSFGDAWRRAGEQLERIANVRYSAAYLRHMQSPAWAQLRARVLARAGGRCEECGAAAPLAVHHRTYARLGDERDDDVVALCADCHDEADRARRRHRRAAA